MNIRTAYQKQDLKCNGMTFPKSVKLCRTFAEEMVMKNRNAKGKAEIFGAQALGTAPDPSHPASLAAAGR